MTTRRQQIFSTLAAAGKKAAAVTKGAAISTGSVLAASWQDARMKDRQKFTDPAQNTAPATKAAAAQTGPAPKDSAAAATAAPLTPFQESLKILANTYKVPENDTQLMDSMKGAQVIKLPTTEKPILSLGAEGTLYELTPRQIHTDADDLSPAQARRMIAFAAANPSMRKNGITIDGNEATRKLLEKLAADAGLKVLNPLVPPAPVEATAETKPETKTAEPAAPAPLPDHIAKVLLGGNVDEATYRAARDFVLAKDKANPNMLQVELDITRTKAKTILNALALEGIVKIDQIKTEKKESLRTIYTVAAQGTPATETPAATTEKPAEEKPVAAKPAAGPAPV